MGPACSVSSDELRLISSGFAYMGFDSLLLIGANPGIALKGLGPDFAGLLVGEGNDFTGLLVDRL